MVLQTTCIHNCFDMCVFIGVSGEFEAWCFELNSDASPQNEQI
jgi:hypothetical protein